MYKLCYSSKMKKDLKTCQKRNLDFSKFESVVNKLRIPEPLEQKNRDHAEQEEEFDMLATKNPYIKSAYEQLQVITGYQSR